MRLPSLVRRIINKRLYLTGVALHDYWRGEPELRLLRQVIDPKRNAVDVGTNYGVYSYFLSRLVPVVYAFEPNPNLGIFVAKSARKNVMLMSFALSDHEGNATLTIPMDACGEVHGRGSLTVIHSGLEKKTVSVRAATLDSFNLENVGFIKIDVEGHEMSVLRGAEKTISAARPRLLIEMDRQHCGGELQGYFDAITSRGYKGWFYWRNKLHSLQEFEPDKHQAATAGATARGCYAQNFFFVHEGDTLQLPAKV